MKERIHLKKMGSFFMSFFAGTGAVHVSFISLSLFT